jgi:hypothetical protein
MFLTFRTLTSMTHIVFSFFITLVSFYMLAFRWTILNTFQHFKYCRAWAPVHFRAWAAKEVVSKKICHNWHMCTTCFFFRTQLVFSCLCVVETFVCRL